MRQVISKQRIAEYQKAQDWINANEAEAKKEGCALWEPIETEMGTVGWYYWGKKKRRKICCLERELPLTEMKGEDKLRFVELTKAELDKQGINHLVHVSEIFKTKDSK